jgi:hypothetical protein
MKPQPNINYNAIQKEIDDNYLDLVSGVLDVYEFTAYISEKYFKPHDKLWGERTDVNPYLDLLFAMIEINDIELY